MSTTPFSYHLYHIPTQKHYYGIKFSKGCHPDMLWKTYFSSSKIVKMLISEHGLESFIVKIRKTFKNAESALLWEHKVLRRINAAARDEWINRHNGGKTFRAPMNHSEETKNAIKSKMIGRTYSEETKRKMGDAAKQREASRRASGWRPPSESILKATATRQSRIVAGEINPYSAERNLKMSASKTGTKRVYLPDGSFKMKKPQEDQ